MDKGNPLCFGAKERLVSSAPSFSTYGLKINMVKASILSLAAVFVVRFS